MSSCQEKEAEVEQASTTSAIHLKRKRLEKAPLVETLVRRSTRLMDLNRGFKKKECSNRNYMACHADPPTLNGKIVKKTQYYLLQGTSQGLH